jgi:hypothetical protein
MAIFALTDAFVSINGVTLSDHANQVTVEDTRDSIDITAFGATSKAVTKGLGDAKITVQLFQDFAAGKTHATLQPLIGSSTPVTIEVRATSSARSATNPAALMSGLLMNYNMLSGSVGDATQITAEFVNAAQAGMTHTRPPRSPVHRGRTERASWPTWSASKGSASSNATSSGSSPRPPSCFAPTSGPPPLAWPVKPAQTLFTAPASTPRACART